MFSMRGGTTISQLRGNKDVKSVEELEADLKKMVNLAAMQQQAENNDPQGKMPGGGENEELSAFNKFVSLQLFISASVECDTCSSM